MNIRFRSFGIFCIILSSFFSHAANANLSEKELKDEVYRLADDFVQFQRKLMNENEVLHHSNNRNYNHEIHELIFLAKNEAPAKPEINPKLPSRFVWKSTTISNWMGIFGFWGLGLGLFSHILFPEFYIDEVAWKSGFGLIIGSIIWNVFLPDPKLALPVGKNKKYSELKKQMNEAIAESINGTINLDLLESWFFERLAQHNLVPPAEVDKRIWMMAKNAGLSDSIFFDRQELLNEMEILKNRIDYRCQTNAYGPDFDPTFEVAMRASTQLAQTIESGKRLSAKVFSRAWLRKQLPIFMKIYQIEKQLTHGRQAEFLLKQHQTYIEHGNRLSIELWEKIFPYLFGFDYVEEIFKNLGNPETDFIRIGDVSGQKVVKRDDQIGTLNIFRVKTQIVLSKGDFKRTLNIERDIETRALTLEQALQDDSRWVQTLSKEIRNFFQKSHQDLEFYLAGLDETNCGGFLDESADISDKQKKKNDKKSVTE